MELRIGEKRIVAIHKGNTPIHGLMVGGYLWHGSAGYITMETSNYAGSAIDYENLHKVYHTTTVGAYCTSDTKERTNVTVSSGGILNKAAVNGGILTIQSGGSAGYVSMTTSKFPVNGVLQNIRSILNIENGAVVDYTSAYAPENQGVIFVRGVLSSGYAAGSIQIYVTSGGTVLNTSASGSAHVTVGAGGVVSKHTGTVNLFVTSGGTVYNAYANPNGRIIIDKGGVVSGCSGYSDWIQVDSGGKLYSPTISAGTTLLVNSGGSAINVVNSGGSVESSYGAYITYKDKE